MTERYDEVMLQFSRGEHGAAIERRRAILAERPDAPGASLALGTALCRPGNARGSPPST